ncbi:MAG: site-specific integrase [Magnetococcus sp. DMHC-8]
MRFWRGWGSPPAQEQRRDRVLSEDEIRLFWHGLDKAGMSEGSRLALRLLLVTAQRKSEVVEAPWSEFDLSAGWWTIPIDRAKNKMAHRVPLSTGALALLTRAKELSGESPYLFPSPRNANAPVGGTSVDHALHRALSTLGLSDLIPHDLRRTAASLMTGMGISRLVVSKILNHVESGITAVYDRHSYDREKRQALDAWDRQLAAILAGTENDNVVPLRVATA